MHKVIVRHVSRISFCFLVGFLCLLVFELQAEPWKCGTPLLCDNITHDHNIEISNDNSIFTLPAAPAKIGQSNRFFVHIPEASIQATCVAIGKYCYIFVEDTYGDMLTDAQAKDVADTFDTEIYPKVHHWIGSETQPGLDRDIRITILFHDVGMNQSGQDYGGYFSPVDLHATHPTSNRRDIVYMDIFQYKQRSRLTFTSSLAHEFAHLINWYQNGGKSDQRWLEEGIASFVEWGIYGYVHTLFVDGYLAAPSMSLTTANTFDTYYGAAFMFLLYLYENHGGLNFIRKLADEDNLGLPAIDTSLDDRDNLVSIFLNWATANWLNNTKYGKSLSYQHLPNRRVTYRTPRVIQYPKTSGNIQIDSWGVQYVLFQNLPTKFELTLNSNSDSYLYANIAYFAPNRNRPIIRSVLPILDVNALDNKRINKIQIGNLSNDGEILLIITSEYPQTFHYTAKQDEDVTTIDIEKLIQTQIPNFHHSIDSWFPREETYAPTRRTQPVFKDHNSLIPSDPTIELDPVSQIHLSSNYNEIMIKDNIAYVTSDWGLEIFSLNPIPIPIGEIATPGQAQAVTIDDEHVYVADGKSGVLMISVNPPTAPRIIKSLGGFHEARDVHFADDRLYALDTLRGLLIFNRQDLENNENPQPRQSFKTDGTPLKVSTNEDGKIYLSDNARGLYILTPDNLGGFTISNTVPLLIPDFQILGRYILAASGDLQVVNIANIFDTNVISRANTPGSVTALSFFQGLLYLTDKQSGLQIVNVDSAQTPRVISSHPTIGNAEDIALRFSAEDKKTYAHIADGIGGIQTIDVTHPDNPIWENHYNAKGVASALDVINDGQNTTIAIANGTGGLKIVELTDPFIGRIVNEIRSIPGQQGVLCVKILNQFAFVGSDTGLTVTNIITGEIQRHIRTRQPVWSIELIKNHAYLCTKSLIVVDISIPEQSRIVAQRTLPGTAYRISYDESHAYVAALEGGVQIFDITEPNQPRHISSFLTDGSATNVVINSHRLFVLDNRHGVIQIDTHNPEQLTIVSEYGDTQLPIAAAISDNHLYLLDIDTLQIIDTRTMTRLSRYSQFHSPTDIVATGSALYVTDKHQLKIFRVNTQQNNLAVEEYPHNYLKQTTQMSLTPKNELLQNHPNPFNPDTWIPYTLAKPTDVSLSIYDSYGRLILQKSLGFQFSGKHTTYWDGNNTIGEPVASGIYFYQLTADGFSSTLKMVIQR